MIDLLLNLLIPHLCISCGHIGAILCSKCKYDIVKDKMLYCLRCGRICHVKHDTVAWYVGDRKAVLQRLVGSYKFNGIRAADSVLAKMLYERAPKMPSDAIVTWIPTIPRHVRERGYDHMHRLAKAFGKAADIPVKGTLRRQSYFVQHKSNKRVRMKQVKGAFGVLQNIDRTCTYILLDDIYTTGATIDEATRVLKAAGVQTVIVGVIARQPLD